MAFQFIGLSGCVWTMWVCFIFSALELQAAPSAGRGGSLTWQHLATGMNTSVDIIFAMRVNVLALNDVFDLGLSAVLDAFQTANELAEMSGFPGERFEVKIVGVTKLVKTSQGLTVPVKAIGSKAPDCVVVPAIGLTRASGAHACSQELSLRSCHNLG